MVQQADTLWVRWFSLSLGNTYIQRTDRWSWSLVIWERTAGEPCFPHPANPSAWRRHSLLRSGGLMNAWMECAFAGSFIITSYRLEWKDERVKWGSPLLFEVCCLSLLSVPCFCPVKCGHTKALPGSLMSSVTWSPCGNFSLYFTCVSPWHLTCNIF